MGHPLRWHHPKQIYEVTTRTIQGRHLLRPGTACREIILGVLGRALFLYPRVQLYGFCFLSSHYHLIASSDDGDQLSAFVGFLNGNIARRLGKLYDWEGPFWARRARIIPIADDQLVARLAYVIGQGVKEGLVGSPEEWPGASAVPALLHNMVLIGRWRELDDYIIELSPLPAWAGLTIVELEGRHRQLVESAAAAAPPVVLGAATVCRLDPHARPANLRRSPAPLVHTACPRVRHGFRNFRDELCAQFRLASRAYRASTPRERCGFPEGSYPPGAPCTPTRSPLPCWRTWAVTGPPCRVRA